MGEQFIRICSTKFDYSLRVGNEQYFRLAEQFEKNFKCNPSKCKKMQFAGVQKEWSKIEFSIHQIKYIDKLNHNSLEGNSPDFRY